MNDQARATTGYEFAVSVGQRLRELRRAKGWSLDDAAKAIKEAYGSRGFTAATLGSWERVYRTMNVAQLCMMADFYGAPMSFLVGEGRGAFRAAAYRPLVFDLETLGKLTGARSPARGIVRLNQFLRSIITERGDYNGRVLTIRDSDMNAICTLIDAGNPKEAIEKLDALGLLWIGVS